MVGNPLSASPSGGADTGKAAVHPWPERGRLPTSIGYACIFRSPLITAFLDGITHKKSQKDASGIRSGIAFLALSF